MEISIFFISFISFFIFSIISFAINAAFGSNSKMLIDPFEEHED
jgi:hypothetical protein